MAEPMLELGKEYPPEDEGEAIVELAALHLKLHQVQPGPSLRGEHSKQHAGVWATFRGITQRPNGTGRSTGISTKSPRRSPG